MAFQWRPGAIFIDFSYSTPFVDAKSSSVSRDTVFSVNFPESLLRLGRACSGHWPGQRVRQLKKNKNEKNERDFEFESLTERTRNRKQAMADENTGEAAHADGGPAERMRNEPR